MKAYSIEELSNPTTYENDLELRKFAVALSGSARQIIAGLTNEHPVDYILAGKYAEQLHKAWKKRLVQAEAEAEAANKATAAANAVLAEITPPAGVTLTLEGDKIRLTIPRDGGLMTPKLKRIGGWWDMEKKCFFLPVDAAKSLPRVLKNWEKEFGQAAAEKAAEAKARAEREARERREREAQAAKAHAENEARWAQEKREREAQAAKARANRTKVEVGQYRVGDAVPYYGIITGFGQSWVEQQPDASQWHGTRYDEQCDCCGRVGEVENETDLCPKCFPHQVKKNVCYAYFV